MPLFDVYPLYNVTPVSGKGIHVYDDKGTATTVDDEMSFTLTIIGQNTGTGWTTLINAVNINGDYFRSYQFGPILTNGPTLTFFVVDLFDPLCSILVDIDASEF